MAEEPLRPYDIAGKCPKCANGVGSMKYRNGWHLPCPIQLASVIRLAIDENKGGAHAELIKTMMSDFPEHFDRVCSNCEYVWAEGVPA